jgi:hypothetical protein
VNLGIGERVLDDQSEQSNKSESEDDSGFFLAQKMKSFTITNKEIVQQEFPFLQENIVNRKRTSTID